MIMDKIKKKGMEKSFEIIVTVVLLLILLIVVLKIIIPKIGKVNVVDNCPDSFARCVSMYTAKCPQGLVLGDYQCAQKDKVCCKYTEKEMAKIQDGENILGKCEAPENSNFNECLCSSDKDVDLDVSVKEGTSDFGYYSKDCTGTSDSLKHPTKYCLPVNKEPYNEYLSGIGNAPDGTISYYCFEFNPIRPCGGDVVEDTCLCGSQGTVGGTNDVIKCITGEMCKEAVCYKSCEKTYGFGPCLCSSSICTSTQRCNDGQCLDA
jgi:hypothetical protein